VPGDILFESLASGYAFLSRIEKFKTTQKTHIYRERNNEYIALCGKKITLSEYENHFQIDTIFSSDITLCRRCSADFLNSYNNTEAGKNETEATNNEH
jgi:hypothetical protein